MESGKQDKGYFDEVTNENNGNYSIGACF